VTCSIFGFAVPDHVSRKTLPCATDCTACGHGHEFPFFVFQDPGQAVTTKALRRSCSVQPVAPKPIGNSLKYLMVAHACSKKHYPETQIEIQLTITQN
jgi:hypothetical protein